jgi:hypothetical protein
MLLNFRNLCSYSGQANGRKNCRKGAIAYFMWPSHVNIARKKKLTDDLRRQMLA